MNQWQPGMCNEKSGFLFSHRCDRIQEGHCERCAKPVCADHSHNDNVGGQMVCTTCMKKSRKRQSSIHHHDPYFHDPYFYGARYGSIWGYGHGMHRHSSGTMHDSSGGMHGVHHDPHDFTEADGESFQVGGDQEFESDMTES